MRLITIMGAVLSSVQLLHAAPSTAQQIGDSFEIRIEYESSSEDSDGSSGSSSGHDSIVERVIAIREDGLELEYDLLGSVKDKDRARQWQFPARVLKPAQGPMLLLNGAEVEARLEGWLKAAKYTRKMCGRWIFTWNAFKIECDPQSVIEMIKPFDLTTADLREGGEFRDPTARAPGLFAKSAANDGLIKFTTELVLDSDAVLREEAETDVVVGEITGNPVTLEAAMKKRSVEKISGTIKVVFETDATGFVRRRVKVGKLEISEADGNVEKRTVTETTERRKLGSGEPAL